MVFTNLGVLVLWAKVALALEGLRVKGKVPGQITKYNYNVDLEFEMK